MRRCGGLGPSYHNLVPFVRIMLVMVVHTAEVERCFSALNLIKTNIRNKLTATNLDVLLRISTCRYDAAVFGNAPSRFSNKNESLLERVVQKWQGMKQRLPNRSWRGARPRRGQPKVCVGNFQIDIKDWQAAS